MAHKNTPGSGLAIHCSVAIHWTVGLPRLWTKDPVAGSPKEVVGTPKWAAVSLSKAWRGAMELS